MNPSELPQIHRSPRAHTVEWQADTLKCCDLGQRHILARCAPWLADPLNIMDTMENSDGEYNVFHEYEKHPHSNWSQICRFIPPAGFPYYYIIPIYTLLNNRQKPMEYGYESKPHPKSTQIVHSWHLWMFIPPVISCNFIGLTHPQSYRNHPNLKRF